MVRLKNKHFIELSRLKQLISEINSLILLLPSKLLSAQGLYEQLRRIFRLINKKNQELRRLRRISILEDKLAKDTFSGFIEY